MAPSKRHCARFISAEQELVLAAVLAVAIRGDRTKLVVGQENQNLVPQNEEEQLYNYYRSKEFVCDNTPLWKLVETLNEAYQVNIIIERPELKALPLDVTFSNESLDVILDVIRQTFLIKVIRKENEIVLE